MGSAVLANKEHNWGHLNNNSFYNNQNPNPKNPNVQFNQFQTPKNPKNPIKPMPTSKNKPGFKDIADIARTEYVTIDLSDYSKTELRELEKRLKAELDDVRKLRTRIEKSENPPKTGSGRKRGRVSETNIVSGFSNPEIDSILKKIMTRCSMILGKIMKHKHAYIFNVPVDAVKLGLHDYFDIVKCPMDLGTIKTKLGKKEYKNPSDFAFDVRLTFKNAMLYNPKGHGVNVIADSLLGLFEKSFNPAFTKFESERSRLLSELSGLRTDGKVFDKMSKPKRVLDNVPKRAKRVLDNVPKRVLDNVPKRVLDNVPKRVLDNVPKRVLDNVPKRVLDNVPKSLPKPGPNVVEKKVKELRVMSFEEKEKLGMCLQELDSEATNEMLVILSKRNAGLEQEGDEIELDFEALDNEMLWELHRFVNKLEKVKAFEVSTPAEEFTVRGREITPVKVDVMEEDVDIGDDSPINNYPPLEIEKDKSSSSGSGSSSSSGSGSVTSSGSDSEGDSVQSTFVEPK